MLVDPGVFPQDPYTVSISMFPYHHSEEIRHSGHVEEFAGARMEGFPLFHLLLFRNKLNVVL